MSRRGDTGDVLHLDDPDAMPCTVTGCEYEGVNLVRKTLHMDSQMVERDVARCRRHTHRYDRLIIGPGPL